MTILDRKGIETVVLSIGGSLVVPKTGIDVDFLKKMNVFVRKQIRESNRRFFIVVGGGSTARQYRDAARDVVGKISDEDLDWIGIHSTRLNAHLVRTIFQDIANPRIIENYARPLIGAREPVIIGAGWRPGWSTDYCAAVLARDYKASLIINLSNIDYVYNKDPRKHKDAQIIKRTTWSYFEDFVGTVITNYEIDDTFFDKSYFKERKKYRISLTSSHTTNILHKVVNFYRALMIKLTINPKNCLDIGCGMGTLVYYLRKLGVQAYGVDFSEFALSEGPKEIQPFLRKANLTDLPYNDDEFDLVVSMDVYEHLGREHLKQAAIESVRVSRKYILHKIYTIENTWINTFHGHDASEISILSQAFWINLFRSIDNVSIVQKFVFKLPTFFESAF